MKRPKVFWLHFNRLNAKRNDTDAWTVHYSGKDVHAPKVFCYVDLETVFRGFNARQPRAYLRGKGYIFREHDGTISIHP